MNSGQVQGKRNGGNHDSAHYKHTKKYKNQIFWFMKNSNCHYLNSATFVVLRLTTKTVLNWLI